MLDSGNTTDVPFAAGAAARRAGSPCIANPEPIGSHDRADWLLGWQWADTSTAEPASDPVISIQQS